MNLGVLALLSAALAAPATQMESRRPPRPPEPDEMLLYRQDETFRLLIRVALDAYFEHFRDAPDKFAVVHYYAGRLAFVEADRSKTIDHLSKSIELGGSERGIICSDWFQFTHSTLRDVFDSQTLFRIPVRHWEGHNPELTSGWCKLPVTMQRALELVGPRQAEALEQHLESLGHEPHVILRRQTGDDADSLAARCPFYDPELLAVHRRLVEWKRRDGHVVYPSNDSQPLPVAQREVRTLRDEPENRGLSLRKFLDRHRAIVWRLGWLYRCRGLELERAGALSAAREHYLRAWAIGDALFPVSDRGRLERLDPVFLAELGDVYARLGRYDLMLRYMYSEQGLPARYEMARPIVELARVAESVRLARADETPAGLDDEALPETVSQILFEQPVVPQPTGPDTPAASPTARGSGLGWLFLASGGVLLLLAVVWRIGRAARKPIQV